MFLKRLGLFLLPVFFVACADSKLIPPAQAKTTILIMGEDYDRDTVPRNNRIFTRVVNIISDLLNTEGYNVFDETAVTMDISQQGRVRRSDAELIDVSRGITQPPIKVLVMFQIYARVKPPKYGSAKLRIRVAGRLLNVQTGQRLGSFEYVAPKEWRITPDCARSRDCVLEQVGDKIKIIGEDVGAVLENKLTAMVAPTQDSSAPFRAGDSSSNTSSQKCLPHAYELTFKGFKTVDYRDIENFIVKFKGYKKHTLSYGGKRRNVYWYNSCIESARLNRNLDNMFQLMGMKSHVSFTGNKFEIRKIRVRK